MQPQLPERQQPIVIRQQTSVPPKQNDPGITFLGMSGGILALVISLVIIICCILPVFLCIFGGLLSALATPIE